MWSTRGLQDTMFTNFMFTKAATTVQSCIEFINHGFPITTPIVWNRLPPSLWLIDTHTQFCRHMKNICSHRPIDVHTNICFKANSAFYPSGVSKWVPALVGKAKAEMVHSVSGYTQGVQVKLWDPLRTHAIPEHLRDVITTRHYTNPHLPLPLPVPTFDRP